MRTPPLKTLRFRADRLEASRNGVRRRAAEAWNRLKLLPEEMIRRNTDPRKMALTVALGVAIGTLPVVWGTTLLCVLAACLFRLNQACIQIVNYAMYPLQFALFVPFVRVGGMLLPATASGRAGFASLVCRTGEANSKGIVAWLLVAPETALLLYLILLPVFRRAVSSPPDASGKNGSVESGLPHIAAACDFSALADSAD